MAFSRRREGKIKTLRNSLCFVSKIIHKPVSLVFSSLVSQLSAILMNRARRVEFFTSHKVLHRHSIQLLKV